MYRSNAISSVFSTALGASLSITENADITAS